MTFGIVSSLIISSQYIDQFDASKQIDTLFAQAWICGLVNRWMGSRPGLWTSTNEKLVAVGVVKPILNMFTVGI